MNIPSVRCETRMGACCRNASDVFEENGKILIFTNSQSVGSVKAASVHNSYRRISVRVLEPPREI